MKDKGENRGYAWKQRSNDILDRDNYRCQNCNRREGRNGGDYTELVAHHIVPGSKLAKEDARIDLNLVALCHKCHYRLERNNPQRQFLKIGRNNIYEMLEMLDEGRCTPGYIAEELDVTPEYVRGRLGELTRLGLVRKVHRGLYEIEDTGQD